MMAISSTLPAQSSQKIKLHTAGGSAKAVLRQAKGPFEVKVTLDDERQNEGPSRLDKWFPTICSAIIGAGSAYSLYYLRKKDDTEMSIKREDWDQEMSKKREAWDHEIFTKGKLWDAEKLRHSLFVQEQNRRLDILRKLPSLIATWRVKYASYLASCTNDYSYELASEPERRAKIKSECQKALGDVAEKLEIVLRPYGHVPTKIDFEKGIVGDSRDLYQIYIKYWLAIEKSLPGLDSEDTNEHRQTRNEHFDSLESKVKEIAREEERILIETLPSKDLNPYDRENQAPSAVSKEPASNAEPMP